MYKTSNDLRFIKNRDVLQRAFIDLTLEKQSTHITVKELTDRAQVNRMTFYSHYDEVTDILLEFVDGITAQLIEMRQEANPPSIRQLLLDATNMMQEEIEFYRLVAQDQHFELYRAQFRKAFTAIFTEELRAHTALDGVELEISAGMLASGITYAYLDWLAGAYGDLPLDELLVFCEHFISRIPYFADGR